ncbi:complex I subunit 4 family protein [Dehalobacterium formicoaceticum]|uniref:NADH-quinone oxidoreductase subunit M n=1 Tax=Dehalobacterium formicoaceticum TaxID=51515 RepID=A0ABT1Y5R8_9FIRM|nr:NADH-quinone oxidoreductase subunit M [Dehalobacterium formicoaceticum]MCR6546232.1 NADH-quinone oxidoreductase subunit M [Dehalobacterium formicoaceticum]
MSSLLLAIIILAPIFGALTILFIPDKEEVIIKCTAALFTFISLVASIVCYLNYDVAKGGMQFNLDIPWVNEFGIRFSLGVDGISLPLILLTALVIFTGVFASWDMHHRIKEFFIFLLVLVSGVFGVFASRDLFFFYLFFEVAVIPMYILIGVWGSTRKEYAAMKLTLYLLVGSAFILMGAIAMFLYVADPVKGLGIRTFDIATLASIKYDPFFQKFAFFLMMVGFGFLVPMWPLHTWSPDGHVAAPTAVSMLHAGVLMKLGGYGLIRVGLFCFPEGAHYWAPLIATLCTVNATYGAFVAMVQKDLKFVIGYSSVSHMGYVLLGIASLNTVGIDGAVAQMFAHGIMTALFFSIVGNIYHKAHTRQIADFGGLAHQMPRVAYSFLIAGLASLGLPGLFNFVAEFSIFTGAIQVYPVRAVISIFAIVVTAIYVLRVMMRVFFGPRNPRWDALPDAKGVEIVPFVILSGTLILLGVFPDLLMNLINNGVVPLAEKVAAFKMGGIF